MQEKKKMTFFVPYDGFVFIYCIGMNIYELAFNNI